MTRPFPFVAAVVAAALLAGCDGSSSTSEPAGQRILLASATVSVGGTVVNGQVVPQGHGQGMPTRFEAILHDPSGRRLTGQQVRLRYDRPQGHGQHHRGELMLHDDGTFGDRVPGDGLYCYEDVAGQYGCHGQGASPGPHHYEFCGLGADGSQSNTLTVTVTVEG